MFAHESAIIDPSLVTAERLALPEFARQGIGATALRLDKIHPVVSGNKWFKLKEHLRIALEKKSRGILTFGGAWSNHIVATAWAAREAGMAAIGFIRGENDGTLSGGSLSAGLRDATDYGMRLEFIPRAAYKKKDEPDFLKSLSAAYPDHYILPEGGAGPAGIKGSEEIGQWAGWGGYSHIVCAIGTGTMFQGLVRSSVAGQKIIGVPVLKGLHHFLASAKQGIDDPERSARCEIIDNYHFGGYARKSEELLGFIRRLHRDTGIPTDFVYTGKLFYAAVDMTNKGYFPRGAELLIIHSGGLQGNRSLPPGTLGF
jgi:1-aminocyclopropane-1-carboxylate deaminase